jgi:hypothetical protein
MSKKQNRTWGCVVNTTRSPEVSVMCSCEHVDGHLDSIEHEGFVDQLSDKNLPKWKYRLLYRVVLCLDGVRLCLRTGAKNRPISVTQMTSLESHSRMTLTGENRIIQRK